MSIRTIAFATGAASGIGEAIATRLAAQGARVVGAELDLAKAQEPLLETTEDCWDCSTMSWRRDRSWC